MRVRRLESGEVSMCGIDELSAGRTAHRHQNPLAAEISAARDGSDALGSKSFRTATAGALGPRAATNGRRRYAQYVQSYDSDKSRRPAKDHARNPVLPRGLA